MGTFILSMVLDLISGSTMNRIKSFVALQSPSTNTKAQRYRTIAFYLFMAASMLLITAAIVDSFGARFVSELFGWSGLVCLQLCVICGLQYARVNAAI